MPLIDQMIEELKYEAVSMRKTLERVPEADLDWQPHPKSMTMRRLASHIAENPAWTKGILETTNFDYDSTRMTPWIGSSVAEIVAAFDKNIAVALEAMKGCPDEALMENWTFTIDGQHIFTLPRVAVLRNMIFSHAIHHRAQFGVYLRLRNVPLPEVYGPSADER